MSTIGSTRRICFFFFNDTAITEIYTLSLHDALPIYPPGTRHAPHHSAAKRVFSLGTESGDRKSTRLNSSHLATSYAVFCLKKNKRTAPSHTATVASLGPDVAPAPRASAVPTPAAVAAPPVCPGQRPYSTSVFFF